MVVFRQALGRSWALLVACSMLAVVARPALADEAPASGGSGEATGTPCASSEGCARSLGYGQVCLDGRCQPYLDQRDLLEWIGLKQRRDRVEAWRLYPSVIPAIGYTPQNGVVVGVTALAGIYLGDPETTTISSLGLIALYTSLEQVILMARHVAMLEGNAWQIQGDYRLLLTNQSTYGLGSSAGTADQGFTLGGLGTTATLAGEQPMDFNLVRVHLLGLRRVADGVYLGASYRLDRYYGIVDQRLDLASPTPTVTSHYAYSTQYGFDPASYTASGLGLEAMLDTRDSTISAYRGWYAHAAFRLYPAWLGSSRDATLAFGEARTYVGLSDDCPRNVLAFWLLAQGVASGQLPYLALPSIGWDFSNRSGRGYIQGRFRGTAQVYGEAEWRFRLTADGLLGGVVFANASTFSRPATSGPSGPLPGEALFDTVRPAGGFGLRFMMNREARNNVTLDFAWGQGSAGIYFGAGEVF